MYFVLNVIRFLYVWVFQGVEPALAADNKDLDYGSRGQYMTGKAL